MSAFARRDALKMLLAAPFAGTAARAIAQESWPTRPVQIIVNSAPGGGADIMARLIFQRVSEILGQPMVMVNRPGGNSVVAAQAALDARSDGYTFLVNGLQQLVNPVLMSKLSLDYSQFQPVTQLCFYPQYLSVATKSPWKTLGDLIAHAKANPGTLRYGTAGIGGVPHLVGELVQMHAGVTFLNIPYRVAPEMTRDLVAGQLEFTILTYATSAPMLQSGGARPLAIASAARSPLVPDVPTFAEAGLPGANQSDWGGLFAGPGVPEPILRRMQEAVSEAVKDPATRGRLEQNGTIGVGSTVAEFRPFLEAQRALFTDVIRKANIKAE